MSVGCKCNWEHPRCKALDSLGRCVALTDTSFPNRLDCPFYDKRAAFKSRKNRRAEVIEALEEHLKHNVKGAKPCKTCQHKRTCYLLSNGCLIVNQALHELRQE